MNLHNSPVQEVDHSEYSPVQEVDLIEYFSQQELEAMSSQQQASLKNMAKNYEIMLYMGLPAFTPDFMKGHTCQAHQAESGEQNSREPVTETENLSHSDSGNDETGSTGLDVKESVEEKICPSAVKPKKRKSENGDPVQKKIKYQRKSDNTVVGKQVHELKETKTGNVMCLDAPGDDDFLYCEECNKEYNMDCPTHGPLDHIRDTEVCTEGDPERALYTLPPGLVVKESRIVGAGLGVFTEKEIPSRVMFGPYGGVKLLDETLAQASGYCWQIYGNGKPSHFVDAKDNSSSNWMRYVNCAPSETEQNLVAFQFKGCIYYRSNKTIPPGRELLCWYGNEYGRELGIVRDKNLLIRPQMVDGQECYPCVFCKNVVTTALDNVIHLVGIHGNYKLTQKDLHVINEWLRKNDKGENTRKQQKSSKIHFETPSSCDSQEDKSTEQTKLPYQNISEIENDITLLVSQSLETDLIKGEKKVFRCEFCDYVCSYKCNLKRHLTIHTGEKGFQCDVCNYTCSNPGSLKKHMRIHSVDKRYKCSFCDYATHQSSSLKTHIRRHTGEKCYKCEICDYASTNSSTLKRHIRKHTGDKCYKCHVCDYASIAHSALKRHMKKHTGEKNYTCDVCDYASNHSSALKLHMKKHTEEKCFTFDVCDYADSYSSDLKKETTEGTEDKCYICDDCEYVCAQSSDMEKHKKVHTDEKCFKCDVCDYACDQSIKLRRHVKIHTGEKSYQCGFCDYVCDQSTDMKKHMRIHTGDKSFMCYLCDYASCDSSNLRVHMRIHTGEKCFKCGVCDYACLRSSSLKRHLKSHEGSKSYKCDVCDYASIDHNALKRHLTIHTGDKLYECDVCDYTCNKSGSLKKHMRIHTGEKCYKCDVCDYACTDCSNLRAHMRKHTRGK